MRDEWGLDKYIVCITGSGYVGLPLAKAFVIENKSV